MLKFLIIVGLIVFILLLFVGLIVYFNKSKSTTTVKTKREKELEKVSYNARKLFMEITSNNINNVNMVSDDVRRSIEDWIKSHNEIR